MGKRKTGAPSSFSVLESLALEVESLLRDFRAATMRLDGSEKSSIVFALIMFIGCFLPWFSPNHTHIQTGLDGFATPHFGISTAVLFLFRRLSLDRCQKSSVTEDGRVAIYLLSLGALSTATCIALLVHFGDIAAFSQSPVDVRYGFYSVLLSGLGISGCGIAKLC